MDYFKSIPTHMDFDGQAQAENLSRIIVVLFGVVGLVWGYMIQQFSQTVYILGAGLVLATLVILKSHDPITSIIQVKDFSLIIKCSGIWAAVH